MPVVQVMETKRSSKPAASNRLVLGLSSLTLGSLLFSAGCNPPTETIPRLKPRKRPVVMLGSGLTTSGMTGSGITSSGMTWSSGITLSGGVTIPSGGITLPSSGITTQDQTYPRLKLGKKKVTSEVHYSLAPKMHRRGSAHEFLRSQDGPVSFVHFLQDSSKPQNPAGKAKPKVLLQPADFKQLQAELSKHKGKVVVVDVWSTACVPCMREFPNLVKLSQKHKKKLACISLNVDYYGSKKKGPDYYAPKVLKFLQKQKALMTNLISTLRDEDMREKLDISSIPAILIYDRTGKLVHRLGDHNTGDDGLTYEGDVNPKVDDLLNQSRR